MPINKLQLKLERILKRAKKYPEQITREELAFVARVKRAKDDYKAKQGAK